MNDEFAAFEAATVPLNVMKPLSGDGLAARTSYIREGPKNGLLLEERVGINPYRIGIVAGSDSHVGATQSDEDRFTGFHGEADDTPERRIVTPENLYAYMVGPGGLTGIWAPQNTRCFPRSGARKPSAPAACATNPDSSGAGPTRPTW